jgi:hypothetical protein
MRREVYRADNFAIIDRENLSPVDQKRSSRDRRYRSIAT